MIFDGLYGIIFAVLEWILPLLPDVTWSVDSSALSYFFGIVETVFYLLPMYTVARIVTIIISLMSFRIFVSLIRTVWDILPIA